MSGIEFNPQVPGGIPTDPPVPFAPAAEPNTTVNVPVGQQAKWEPLQQPSTPKVKKSLSKIERCEIRQQPMMDQMEIIKPYLDLNNVDNQTLDSILKPNFRGVDNGF